MLKLGRYPPKKIQSSHLKIRGRRRQRQRRWKSEFVFFDFFQSSLRLLQVTNFFKCRRTILKLNSQEPYPSAEREWKFRRRLCTSSAQREIRHFQDVVVQWRQRNVQKAWFFRLSCLLRGNHQATAKSYNQRYSENTTISNYEAWRIKRGASHN